MAGRDHRRNVSSLSAGRLERRSAGPSPAWSQQLPAGSGSGSGKYKSLFRSIGVWFSSLSTSSSSSLSSSKKNKKRSTAAALPAPDDAIKKPPSFGHGAGRPSLLRGPGGGLYGSNGSRRGSVAAVQQFQSSVFTMEEILKATSNFSPALKIGQGGFGAVYRGVLPDGTVVAVKRARTKSPHVDVEFRSEVKIMARVEHQSLVRFYGYLEHGDERVVVIEHVPGGTLREHLDRCHGGRFLELAARLDIAIDVAHGVTYLHMYSDHPIIHRDIKSSNILLTASLRAKVADFGFARLGAGFGTGTGDSNGGGGGGARHVTTQVKGTAGYLDPEYLKTCQLTDRSDVYSFGVLLVELVSGRRPIEPKREMQERLTARWAMRRLVEGRAAEEVLDPCLLRTDAAACAAEAVLELAFRCMGPVRDERPSMDECCRALWAVRKTYKDMAATTMGAYDGFSDRGSSSSGSTGADIYKI